MSQAELEKEVTEYLRNSWILEDQWQRPITPDQLQAEMDRMAEHSRQPKVLRELFTALGNDPYVIAECFARPMLAKCLLTNSYSHDQESLGSSSARETQIATNYVLPAISSQPNDCDDSWTATSTTNAPSPRNDHTAVWTGSEMIVWGGQDSTTYLNTGGRYNPSTDSWTPTSTLNAPAARKLHTAVWTGTEMIVWGGYDGNFLSLNSGGRYDPGTDSWTATTTTNAPTARGLHTAVWTGTEMIVWGGVSDRDRELNTGGRYNPATDNWTATTATNAPTGRERHTAVWTDSEMIVWGGWNGVNYFSTGGKYCAQTSESITLEARVIRQGGIRIVVLTWSPADGGTVNVLRNGVVVAATDDDGTVKDKLGTQTGTFTYQVCETDSGDCSNEVRVRVRGSAD